MSSFTKFFIFITTPILVINFLPIGQFFEFKNVPALFISIITYILVGLYWVFFWRKKISKDVRNDKTEFK